VPVAFKQEVNVPLILTVGIVSAIFLVVSIVGTEAWYDNEEAAEMAAKAVEFPHQDLIDLKEAQMANISSYRWIDRKNQVVAIPIEDSMRIMVENNGKFPASRPSGNAAK
jgi:hypothetical protein